MSSVFEFGFMSGLFIIVLLYILPFLVAVVLPVVIITKVVAYLINKHKAVLPSFKPFIFTIIGGSIVANVLWEVLLFNHVYYEWDRIFLPYTLLGHEVPNVDDSISWLADGWQLWHLDLIWFVVTITLYTLAWLIAIRKSTNSAHSDIYSTALKYSVAALTILSIAVPALTKLLPTDWAMPENMQYEEVDTACEPSAKQTPQILYVGDQNQWISGMNGENLRKAFDKNLQLRFVTEPISPDENMAAVLWNNQVWVYCLNTNGAHKIQLPETYSNDSMYYTGTNFSWLPDSTHLVLGISGDVLLLNVQDRTVQVLKNDVAIQDNKVDKTSKDRDTFIPPFEYGSVIAAGDGSIYYTEFKDRTTKLHKLNRDSNTDEVILESTKQLSIQSVSPNSSHLILNENDWALEMNRDNPYYSIFLFDIQSKKKQELIEPDLNEIVWSPTGESLAMSTGGWMAEPEFKAFPALITNLDGTTTTNVSEIVMAALTKQSVTLGDGIVIVQVKDFVDEKQVLVKISILYSQNALPRIVNGVLDLQSQDLQILQTFSDESYQNNQEIIEPYRLLKTQNSQN